MTPDARDLIRRLTSVNPAGEDGECVWCPAFQDLEGSIAHLDGCAWAEGRALLGERLDPQ